mmetsp:Transcript_35184/g.40435  ORF Transcript_35184/g.40435 Transcript_35184/m.40435 type:complete len:147 (-) Transcript_35184:34-474(-)
MLRSLFFRRHARDKIDDSSSSNYKNKYKHIHKKKRSSTCSKAVNDIDIEASPLQFPSTTVLIPGDNNHNRNTTHNIDSHLESNNQNNTILHQAGVEEEVASELSTSVYESSYTQYLSKIEIDYGVTSFDLNTNNHNHNHNHNLVST